MLGFKVVEVGSGLEHRLARLRSVARPHLEAIQRETGETVNLVVLDADRVVYVDQVEGSRSVRMFTAVGTSALAHTTGSGKAIMAFGAPDDLETRYAGAEPLQRLTPRTLVTLDDLREDFARIRRRGYALDNEEHEEGVGCVACPVFDHTGAPGRGDERLRPVGADPPRRHRRSRRPHPAARRRHVSGARPRALDAPRRARARRLTLGRIAG